MRKPPPRHCYFLAFVPCNWMEVQKLGLAFVFLLFGGPQIHLRESSHLSLTLFVHHSLISVSRSVLPLFNSSLGPENAALMAAINSELYSPGGFIILSFVASKKKITLQQKIRAGKGTFPIGIFCGGSDRPRKGRPKEKDRLRRR